MKFPAQLHENGLQNTHQVHFAVLDKWIVDQTQHLCNVSTKKAKALYVLANLLCSSVVDLRFGTLQALHKEKFVKVCIGSVVNTELTSCGMG